MFNYPGTPVTFDFEVRDTDDVLVVPATVEFWWRTCLGGRIAKNTTPSATGIGQYRVIFTPDSGGTVFWRFRSTVPTVVANGRFYVEEPEFDEFERDYV